MYRPFELNFRNKPAKGLNGEKHHALALPQRIDGYGLYALALGDARGIRLFNVIDDHNREALGISVDFPLLTAD